jgi:hypothetical protein
LFVNGNNCGISCRNANLQPAESFGRIPNADGRLLGRDMGAIGLDVKIDLRVRRLARQKVPSAGENYRKIAVAAIRALLSNGRLMDQATSISRARWWRHR